MITLWPVITKKQVNKMIAEWHSHHKGVQGYKFAIEARIEVDRTEVPVGCVVVSRPVAQALNDGRTLEVTRLCCRGGDKHVASKLLGAAWRASEAQGVILMVSYTRVDEDGTCYKAAGWAPVSEVKGREWTGGNKEQRWLPGMYAPSTEIVDRIRWEKRPYEHIRAVVRMVASLGTFAKHWSATYEPKAA